MVNAMATFSGDVLYIPKMGQANQPMIYFMSKKKEWVTQFPMVSGQAMDSMDPGSTRKLRVKFTTNFTW